MTAEDNGPRDPAHIVTELGFQLESAADGYQGWASIVPEMHVPGTTTLRTSILATWADIAAGYVAVDVLAPRVPVTLDLDLNLYREPADVVVARAVSRRMKAGRSVVAISIDFRDEAGRELAIATASFMAAPDPALTFPPEHLELRANPRPAGRLRVPFAERARCVRSEPGTAVLPRSADGLNSSRTVNGGLIALAIEEAALSASPGTTLSSLAMRYLRPVRLGPAIARADVKAGLGRVEVRDAGNGDRLAVSAVTRTWPTRFDAQPEGTAA